MIAKLLVAKAAKMHVRRKLEYMQENFQSLLFLVEL